MSGNIANHLEYFTNYTKEYASKYSPLQLKYEHSLLVLAHAQKIVATLSISSELKRAIILAALYHDFGRFEQYAKYQTFADHESENHAHLGVKMLKKLKVFSAENNLVKHYCLAAIALHNKYKLPTKIDTNLITATNVIRDADKIDILRIMSLYLSGQKKDDSVTLNVINAPEQYSKIIIQDIVEHRVGSYANLISFNDFRLLLGTWVNDLYFVPSLIELREQKYLDLIFQDLPKNPEIQMVIKILYKRLEEKCCAI